MSKYFHVLLYKYWPPYQKRHNAALIEKYPRILEYADKPDTTKEPKT